MKINKTIWALMMTMLWFLGILFLESVHLQYFKALEIFIIHIPKAGRNCNVLLLVMAILWTHHCIELNELGRKNQQC